MKLEKLGPYRILQQIGKGGMGAVYVAAYEGGGSADGTRVAVKALSPQLALAEGFRERFEAEIDSLKKLKHENIVRLFGYGEQDGVLFYSMELVEGTSLEEEINAGRRFDWHETLQIGIQVCKALKHAHDHGVVHRDIKPANLLVTKDRQIKIADFGIARLFGGTQLTTAGGVLGTADYMSPEQADGRPVTEKCDQYSLGGVMYALLAGRPPFRAKTMPEMLQKQRFAESEPVRRYASDTPVQLEKLLLQLLAKNPEERFPNVLVLARHMEAMDKALSREVDRQHQKQDRASGSKTLAGSIEHTLAIDEGIPLLDDDTQNPDTALFSAPTLAQAGEEVEAESAKKDRPTPGPAARFTTVDEESRRIERESNAEDWLGFVAKWAALLLLLGSFGGLGWWFTRPVTADDLYTTIADYVEENGTSDLRPIGDEIDEFLKLFPTEPRAEEVSGLQEQIELQKLERRAMARSRFMNVAQLTPVEQLYLEAREVSEKDPAAAQQMFQDMLTLYDPRGLSNAEKTSENSVEGDVDVEVFRWLALARQQLARTKREADKIAQKKLPQLQERLREAEQMERTDPALAAQMYRALIRLYEDRLWAADLVMQARQHLNGL